MDDHPLTRRIAFAQGRWPSLHGQHCYNGGLLVCGWPAEHEPIREPREPVRFGEGEAQRSDQIAAGRGHLLR